VGHSGVGKSCFINAIETVDKDWSKKQKDKETREMYAVDEEQKMIYDLEITKYTMMDNSSLIGSYFWDKHLCIAIFSLNS